MNVTSTQQAKGGVQVAQPILTNTQFRSTNNLAGNFVRGAQASPRHVGYGLPCSECGTYYTADQSVCPVCKCAERVSPTAIPVPTVLQKLDEADDLGQDVRKKSQSQLLSAHLQDNVAASFRCSLEENHHGGHEPAAICKPCYDHLRERADLMEAALHIDLKEAAQIVYDAVWSDPSDPTKSYQNAAQALLTELRKRSGINMILFREAQRLSPHRPQSRRCRKRISVMFGEDKDPDIPIVKQAKAEYAKL